MSTGEPVLACEMCELPHVAKAVICDGCGHSLGVPLNIEALRQELATHRKRFMLGVTVTVAMLALNVVLFRGAGAVLLLAPIGWAIHSAIRYRAISKFLSRIDGPLAKR